MMRRTLVAALCGAALVATPVAVGYAQDVDTGGVTRAEATAACAGILDEPAPADALIAGFRAAYNTVDNTDDGPASVGISADWQRLIYLQELHIDYLGLDGLDDTATFTCTGGVAAFPDLALAADVRVAICGNPALDDITDATLRARVEAALAVLGEGYADVRADCDTPDPTLAPTPTLTPAPTTAPTLPDSDDEDGDFDQIGGRAPSGGVATGG